MAKIFKGFYMKRLAILGIASVFSVLAFAVDGAEIYKKCVGCHGVDGTQKYHPKASPIVTLRKDRRLRALEGYKEGNNNKYGMGSAMRAQVQNLNQLELEAVNEYIESLKK